MIMKVISVVSACECVRILAIAPMPSYSHQISYRPIWLKLLSRGHHITLLTTDPMRDPGLTNLTEIDLHFAYKLWNETEFHNSSKSMWDLLLVRRNMFVNLIDNELASAGVRNLIQDQTKHFDLMMIEFLYPTMYRYLLFLIVFAHNCLAPETF